MGVIFLCQSVALYLFEKGTNPELDSVVEGIWWVIIFIASGFEILPQTLGGRLVATLFVIEGLGLLGIIVGGFASHFVERTLYGGKIMNRVKFKNHIIVCGWTPNTPKILDELTSEDVKTKRKIVVLADLEKNPLDREDIAFVRGDPTRDEDLIRAGIMTANTAIITLDRKSDNPDAKVILTALAVESLNGDVYSCVELENPENEKHLVHANVDEIVCFGRLSRQLIVNSSLNPGLSQLFSELMTHNVGHEIYKLRVPKRFTGDSFPVAVKRLIDEEGIILTAVERKIDKQGRSKRDIIINPGHDFVLEDGDSIFVIAKEEPEIQ